jgi:AraC-like DNA-binding protein
MPDRDLVFLHGLATPRCRARVDKHFVGYCALQFMAEGAMDVSYNARRYVFQGSWLWPCMPGPRIRFHPAADGPGWWNHRYVAITGARLDHWRTEGLWPSSPQPAPSDIDMVPLFDEVLRLIQGHDRWDHQRAGLRLEEILVVLARARQQTGPEAAWLVKARALLDIVPVENHDGQYEEIARQCGLPMSTFRRKFHDATGMGPREYAILQRMNRARVMLLESTASAADIAEQLGYQDQAFFSRQFRQLTGMTPLAYRRSNLVGG